MMVWVRCLQVGIPAHKCKTDACLAGISGSADERVEVVTASVRSLPLRMIASDPLKLNVACPDRVVRLVS
jgi:hypothetical protein